MRESSTNAKASPGPKIARRFISNVAALALILCLITATFLVRGDRVEKVEKDQSDSFGGGSGFTVYTLRGVPMKSGANSTSITFNSTGLPFAISSLLFTKTQSVSTIGVKYYAGSGMIFNVTGPSGNVTIREQNGKVIRTIGYDGQPSVVLNGESAYSSTPKPKSEFEGADILVQDWLKGTWSPEKGVFLERPTGMTVDEAQFYLMVFQPSGPIPEFGAFSLVLPMVAALWVVLSKRSKKRSGLT